MKEIRLSEFFLFCLAFVLVRLPFIFTVPMSEAPDELTHFWIIEFIHKSGHLPTAAEVAAGGTAAVYGSLPPLGYLPHLLVTLVTPAAEMPLFARFGSLLMGLVLLYAAYHMGKELFAKNRLLQLLLPACVIFHPQLAFVHSYSNNDATAAALSGCLLLLSVRTVRLGVEIKRCLVMGLLLGWLVLSKYSGLSVLPVVLVALFIGARLNKTPIGEVLRGLVVCGAAGAAVSLWWFYRNYHEFSGDILGTATMYKSWAMMFHKDLNYHLPVMSIITEVRWWRMMYFSYWGLFGYMTKYMWRPVYIVYIGYVVAAAAGLICSGIKYLIQKSAETSNESGALDAKVLSAWALMALSVIVNLSAMIWASTTNLGGPQGRYLFISEIPVMSLMLLGLYQAGGKWAKKVVLSFLLFNVCVCAGAWLMLFFSYGFHVRPL